MNTPQIEFCRELQNFQQQVRIRTRELWFIPAHLTPFVYFPMLKLTTVDNTNMKVCVSHSVSSSSLQPHGLQPARLLHPWNSPGNKPGVDSHSLLQRIFLTQELNPGLLHCRHILYHLSHQGYITQILGLSSFQEYVELFSKKTRVTYLKFSNIFNNFFPILTFG